MKRRDFLFLASVIGSKLVLPDSLFALEKKKKQEAECIVDSVTTTNGNTHFIVEKEGKRFVRASWVTPGDYFNYWSLDDSIIDEPLVHGKDSNKENILQVSNCRKEQNKDKVKWYYLEQFLEHDEGIKIIDIWTDYCIPCRRSIPKLKEYEKDLNKFKDIFGQKCSKKLPKITIYALAWQKDAYQKARNFAKNRWDEIPKRYLAREGYSKEVAKIIFGRGDEIPKYILIDEDHHIRKVSNHEYPKHYKSVSEFMQVEILRPYFNEVCKKK